MEAFEDRMRLGGAGAVKEATSFFMKDDPVHGALQAIARRLDAEGVPYAVAGGMALVAHGYDRTTVDIDVLVTDTGLRTIHERLVGLGYRPAFEGSRKQLRDTDRGVRVEFLVSGEFPGDGKPKAVAFPDPTVISVDIGGIRYLRLSTLVELKLASGISHPGRLKDLADVQELIRARDLPLEFRDELDPSVRDKYTELWRGTHP
jgi:Uncharacterised nucleotidyltransferase